MTRKLPLVLAIGTIALLSTACGSDATDAPIEAGQAEERSKVAPAPDTTNTTDTSAWTNADVSSVAPADRDGYFATAGAPALSIDLSQTYVATFVTDNGEMKFRLFDDQAPVTVNSFIKLADAGFYDGLTFHRVIDQFMAQGGDPTGLGGGGPGYQFRNEYTTGIEFDKRGQLAMANAGLNTNGSQFFITFNGDSGLPATQYTIFGELLDGEDALSNISMRDPVPGADPGDLIQQVVISTDNTLPPLDLPQWEPGAGVLDPVDRNGYYKALPPMVIDINKTYTAIFTTENGEMRFELFDDAAPITVNSFAALANDGFFDGLTFHRVLESFMAQGGDPTGLGSGGPGYQFTNEYTPGIEFDKRGQLAMANSGPNTNGSQFFITFNGENGLPASQYTIFGELLDGDDTLGSIGFRDPNANPDFIGDSIVSVRVEEN